LRALFEFIDTLKPAAGPEVYRPHLQDRLDRSYLELRELTNFTEFSEDELKALKAALEKVRNEQLEKCRKAKEGWQQELDSARKALAELNRSSSSDPVRLESRFRSRRLRGVSRLDRQG
jgi:hypothetical protein